MLAFGLQLELCYMPRPLDAPLDQPIFSEPGITADPIGFGTPHPSDSGTYAQIGNLLKTEVVGFPVSRVADDGLFPLADAYGARGADVVAQIEAAGRIIFHAVGDTGASDVRKYTNELRVADQLSADAATTEDTNRAAFFFHLGDVVYNFGEAGYYYDQFYEPFRAYPAPIIAIPGNHDSFVLPGTAPGDEPLNTFARQFCAETPIVTAEAGSLHRTAMTQPGVYFALGAPFVRIIGLFSNALEDPGVISSEGGRWPAVPDTQLAFLAAQLNRVKTEAYAGAVLIAVHHPPFVYSQPLGSGGVGGNHGSSSDMLRDIDTVCQAAGVYPHAVLSAHAHCYQRYTRHVTLGENAIEVPFVVCGSGGHNINPLIRATRGAGPGKPENGADVGYLEVDPAVSVTGLTLEKYDDQNYGYLRISVDAKNLRIAFHQANVGEILRSRFDLVTLDIATRKLVANTSVPNTPTPSSGDGTIPSNGGTVPTGPGTPPTSPGGTPSGAGKPPHHRHRHHPPRVM